MILSAHVIGHDSEYLYKVAAVNRVFSDLTELSDLIINQESTSSLASYIWLKMIWDYKSIYIYSKNQLWVSFVDVNL